MIIDAHAHLAKDNIKKRTGELLDSMKKAGIAKTALFADFGNFSSLENTIEIAKKFPDKFFPVGFIVPNDSKFKESNKKVLKYLKEGVLRGVKFYLGYQSYYPNNPALAVYYKEIEKSGFPAIFHTGDTYNKNNDARLKYTLPILLDDVAVEFPKMKIIIAHFGNPWINDAAAVLYKNKNVYADISGWAYNSLSGALAEAMEKKLMEMHGYLENFNKLLFGTDYPIVDQKSYVKFTKNLPITEKEKKKIFCDNARELFRI